jgi:hypothetical protein
MFGTGTDVAELVCASGWSLTSVAVKNGVRDVTSDFAALSSSGRKTKTFVFLF